MPEAEIIGITEKPIGEDVVITTEITAADDVLIIKETPSEPVPIVTTYNLAEIRAEIARIDGAIAAWNEKRAPLQAIIDQYDANK